MAACTAKEGTMSSQSRKAKGAPTVDKDALRRHKALEKQYNKARLVTLTALGLVCQPS